MIERLIIRVNTILNTLGGKLISVEKVKYPKRTQDIALEN